VLKRIYFMTVVDGKFCLKMGAVRFTQFTKSLFYRYYPF